MTSEQALAIIKYSKNIDIIANEIKPLKDTTFKLQLDIIEKDLKILSVLKKYVKELNKFAIYDEATNNITTLKIISMIDLREDNKDYKIIKDWLEE